ncbi:hypothetical protein ES319_A13G016700v1 [Gossypium barbadense]|uniref:Uncharacterized protein n=2 Tax=Gossypium TaxID=3633 RepID=A0A5J5SUD7_GOSBA|nr:hypothetical protein ES319_A13G016700v1 [Gossypium barbadense]
MEGLAGATSSGLHRRTVNARGMLEGVAMTRKCEIIEKNGIPSVWCLIKCFQIIYIGGIKSELTSFRF